MTDMAPPKYTVDDYCEVSTYAGVIDWYRAKSKGGKVFWAVILLLSLGVTIWQTFEAFVAYLDPTNRFQTVITIKPDLGNNAFPSVTVCNFNISRLMEDNISDPRLLEYAFSALPVNYHIPLNVADELQEVADQMDEIEKLWDRYVQTRHNDSESESEVHQMLRKYGHECDETVLMMGFQNERYRQPCGRFAQEAITDFGRCYRFDMSNKTQIFPGKSSAPPDVHPMHPSGFLGASMGLQMIVNPALDLYLNDTVISNFLEEGVLLSFDYTEDPTMSNPVVVGPGTHAFVSLRLTEQIFTRATYPMFDMPCRKPEDTKLAIVAGKTSLRPKM